ncbi:MAG: Fic family protein [Patescibacteria group bacterium]
MKTISSTKPKGATSYRETAFGVISRSKLLNLELKGTKRGLDLIHKLISENQKLDITPDLVLKIHEVSFGWIFPDWAGKYRNVQVEFSGKVASPYHKIPEMILGMCQDLKERLKHLNSADSNYLNDVLELLAWFQHRFVFIHPFLDYNGRVARMLTILIILKLNLPPVEIKAETGNDRKKYLEAMYAADDGDYQKLINLIGAALKEYLSK